MCVWMFGCMCMYVCVDVWLYVYVCVCLFVSFADVRDQLRSTAPLWRQCANCFDFSDAKTQFNSPKDWNVPSFQYLARNLSRFKPPFPFFRILKVFSHGINQYAVVCGHLLGHFWTNASHYGRILCCVYDKDERAIVARDVSAFNATAAGSSLTPVCVLFEELHLQCLLWV